MTVLLILQFSKFYVDQHAKKKYLVCVICCLGQNFFCYLCFKYLKFTGAVNEEIQKNLSQLNVLSNRTFNSMNLLWYSINAYKYFILMTLIMHCSVVTL